MGRLPEAQRLRFLQGEVRRGNRAVVEVHEGSGPVFLLPGGHLGGGEERAPTGVGAEVLPLHAGVAEQGFGKSGPEGAHGGDVVLVSVGEEQISQPQPLALQRGEQLVDRAAGIDDCRLPGRFVPHQVGPDGEWTAGLDGDGDGVLDLGEGEVHLHDPPGAFTPFEDTGPARVLPADRPAVPLAQVVQEARPPGDVPRTGLVDAQLPDVEVEWP